MQRLFNVEKGLASDIMYAQDLCRGIVEEAAPMENEVLKILQNEEGTLLLAQTEDTKDAEDRAPN